MPSLKEIKNRISSVNSTRKITSSMKTVASSKLHNAQTRIENMLPYEAMLEGILKTFIASDVDAQSALSAVQGKGNANKVAIIAFSSNSSLCGGFNGNVIKSTLKLANEYKAKGTELVLYPIGRKVAEKMVKEGLPVAGDYMKLADKPNAKDCQTIGEELMAQFLNGELDEVLMVYHHFKSAGSQILTTKKLLPIDVEEAMNYDHYRDLQTHVATAETVEYERKKRLEAGSDEQVAGSRGTALNSNYLVEPSMDAVMTQLIPQYVNLMLYTALLDSNASEHAARMVAMQTATDNADELLRQLNLQYNKSRQQAITNELLDIVAGPVNANTAHRSGYSMGGTQQPRPTSHRASLRNSTREIIVSDRLWSAGNDLGVFFSGYHFTKQRVRHGIS